MIFSKTRTPDISQPPYLQKVFCAVLIVLGLVMYGNILNEAHNLSEPWFDDAFMYIRYAENINAGNGYCWNKEESPLYGCTDIAHGYLIATAKKLFPSAEYASIAIWLPVLNYGLIILVLCIFVAAFWKERPSQRIVAITFIVVGLLLNPFLPYHLYTGMDTVLSFSGNAVLIMMLLLLERKKTSSLAMLAAVAAWFSWFLRPDNIFYAFVFPALFILFRLCHKKKLVITYVVAFSLLIVTDTSVKYFVFHEILPLSFYVKSSGFFTGYMGVGDWNPLLYLFMFIAFCWLWILLLTVLFRKQQADRLVVFMLPVFLTLVYFFDSVQMMGSAARFYFPSIPFLLFAAIESYFKTNSFSLEKSFPSIAVVFLLFGVCILSSEKFSEKYGQFFLQGNRPHLLGKKYPSAFPIYTEGAYDFFDFCSKLPANTLVAAGEHGRLAAYNPQLRILDLYGLHNTYFAHNGFSADYLLKQKPAIIQLAHYNFTKINVDIVSHPDFVRDYDFYPNLYGFGVAVRKEESVVKKIFEDEIMTTYGLK